MAVLNNLCILKEFTPSTFYARWRRCFNDQNRSKLSIGQFDDAHVIAMKRALLADHNGFITDTVFKD